MSMGGPVTNARSTVTDFSFAHLDTDYLVHLYNNMISLRTATNVPRTIMDSSFGHLDTEFLMHPNTNMSMDDSHLIKVPRTNMDSSIAHLDVDFLMNSDLVSSAVTAPESQARVHPTASGAGPFTGGFCMTPKRGLGTRTQAQLRGLSRRTQSQRYLVGFSACMVDIPDMTIQETFGVHTPKDQN
jgi:hypothetical protein